MDAKSIKEAARHFGADLVGITAIDNFAGVAPENSSNCKSSMLAPSGPKRHS